MLFFLRFVTRRTFRNMKGNLLTHVTTIAIIGISMLIFSSFSLVAFNLTSFLKAWEEKIEIIAYIKKGVPVSEVEELYKKIQQVEGVETLRYVSSQDAMNFLGMKLGHQKNLLEGIQAGILPASFEIRLMKEFRNTESLRGIVSQLRQLPQLDEIQYGQEWVETFLSLSHLFRITQWVLGGLLLMGIAFITFNTLQLSISSRKEEIEIMHILGARPSFIQVPFYIEGMIQGLVGTGLAILLLFYLHYEVLLYKVFFLYITPSMREWLAGIPIRFLPAERIVLILLGGVVLGFFGSFAASMRFLTYRV